MTQLSIVYGLPFVTVILRANGHEISLPNVLIDTGSAASIFRTDDLLKIGVQPALEASIRFVSEIGGREAVIESIVDALSIDDLIASSFTIQMGRLDYGFAIDGIIGLDFLLHVGAVIDLKHLEIRKGP